MTEFVLPSPEPENSDPLFTCHYCGQKKVGLQGR